MRVLVTGGTGLLDRALVRSTVSAGHAARVLSRRTRAATEGVEYAVGDIAAGAGLDAALSGVEAIIHAASDPRRPEEVDVGGTRRLVEAARAAGVGHLVYVSIVGVDRIPVRYYRMKLEAEGAVAASGLPHGGGPPPHSHDEFDEAYYVLEDELELLAGSGR
ncbi:MAG: NAD(P)H-binding protein [Acidobacteria bacterium]|nr:NAD(P)H-binding protein [Acidobacteriota bacterium]